MASSKTFLVISIYITLTIILIQQNTEAIKRDPSNLLSLLTNRLHHGKQPLIIVIGKDPAVKDRVRVDKALSAETSGESVHLMHHLMGHGQLMKKAIQNKKSTLKPYHQDEKKRQRFRSQRLREEESVLQREDKSVLRSPIVKQLLRISNSLRCQAKDECQDKCSIKFNGLRGKKCHIQCEIKYVCEEEEEEKKEERDSCGDGDDNDSCGRSEEMNGSTRGEKLVTEKP